MDGIRRTIYKVYEISPECRKFGRLKKIYLTKRLAEKYMNASIYRYIKEDICICEQISNMFSADEANALYHEKRKPEVTEQVDRVLRLIKNRAYEGYNYAMYCPRKRLLKETLSIVFDLVYSIRGFEGKYNQRYEYNFFWGDEYLKNPVNKIVEYDDSMDYTRD